MVEGAMKDEGMAQNGMEEDVEEEEDEEEDEEEEDEEEEDEEEEEEDEEEDEDEDEEAAAADGDFEEEEEAWSPEASGRRGGTRSGLQRGAETQPRLPPSKIELRAAGLRPRLWNSKECRERWMHALKTVSK